MTKKTVTFVGMSLLLFGLIGCGTTNDNPVVKEINDIAISPTSATIYATTNELDLKAYANYSDGTRADITEACGWETDFSKASLAYGKLIPKINGDSNGSSTTLDITISYRSLGDTQNNMVTIVPLAALHIDDSNISGTPVADTTYTFKATADYANGDQNISIDTNNSNQIVWSVEGNATLVNVGGGEATVSFSKGEANVTVTGFYDINATKSYTIN